MCTESNCCCLDLETGTLIFGIMASAFNGLCILTIIGGIIAFNILAIQDIRPNTFKIFDGFENLDSGSAVYYAFDPRPMIFINMGLILALLKSVMDFTFTVLLCKGVSKRNPSHIKAYYIYGIVMAVLGSCVMVGVVVIGDLVTALVFTIVLIFYSLILHMVNLTRNKITSGEVYGFEHKRLSETVD